MTACAFQDTFLMGIFVRRNRSRYNSRHIETSYGVAEFTLRAGSAVSFHVLSVFLELFVV